MKAYLVTVSRTVTYVLNAVDEDEAAGIGLEVFGQDETENALPDAVATAALLDPTDLREWQEKQ